VTVRLLPIVLAFAAWGQELPAYSPRPVPAGVVRVLGNSHMSTVMGIWEEGFRHRHPGVTFDNKYLGTANAIAGLYLDTADLSVMGREIMPMEDIAYRRAYPDGALGIAVATASFNVPLETFAFAVFVNRRNPIEKLTLRQLDAIFGTELKRGASSPARTWGDLGMKGEWESRPLYLHGYEIGTGLDYFFEQRVLGGSHKWNPGLHEYANVYEPGTDRKLVANAGDLIVRAIAADPGAIGFCGYGHVTPEVKALALSNDGAAFVPLTRDNVLNCSYPLTRTVYIYLNRSPRTPLAAEFLRYVLSAEGQAGVAQQGVYLPLTGAAVREELSKLGDR
jgi:phosphate transport system substrate-binding protein